MTRLNEFTRLPEHIYMATLKWTTQMSLHGKLPSQTSLHGPPHMTWPNLMRLNEFTWVPSHDMTQPAWTSLHGKPYMFTWVPIHDQMKAHERAGKISHTNMHKAHLGEKISIFYMGSCDRACPHTQWLDQTSLQQHPQTTHPNKFTRPPSNNPLKQFYTTALKWPTRISLQDHPQVTKIRAQGPGGKMSSTNMHTAHLGSQLRIFYTGSFA